MKSKYWALVLAVMILASAAAGIPFLMPAKPAHEAQIRSDGQLIRTVSLTSVQDSIQNVRHRQERLTSEHVTSSSQ